MTNVVVVVRVAKVACAVVAVWYGGKVAFALGTDGVLLFVALCGLFGAHGLVEYDGWRQRKRDARMQASFERAMAAGSLDEEAYAFAVGEEGKRSAERDETVNWVVGVLGTLALVRLVFQWLFR